MTKRSCHSSLLVKCALPSVLSSSTEENLSSKNGEGTARKILSSWALLGSIPLHHLHREVYWKDEYGHLRKRRGGRVAKIVFPMSGTSFLLNTVDFGNSSSIIPRLAWPTFVSKFNHIAPCFAFFFCRFSICPSFSEHLSSISWHFSSISCAYIWMSTLSWKVLWSSCLSEVTCSCLTEVEIDFRYSVCTSCLFSAASSCCSTSLSTEIKSSYI